MNQENAREVANRLRGNAHTLEDGIRPLETPEQVVERLRLMALELEDAADKLERYVAEGGT